MYLSLLPAIRFYYGFNNTLYYIFCVRVCPCNFHLFFFFFKEFSAHQNTAVSGSWVLCFLTYQL